MPDTYRDYRLINMNIIKGFMTAATTMLLLCFSYVVMIVSFMLRFTSLPPQIPLFYSRPSGEEQIVDLLYIVSIPLMSTILVFINNFIVKKYYSENEIVKKMFYYTNNTIIIVFTIIFLKILFLVS